MEEPLLPLLLTTAFLRTCYHRGIMGFGPGQDSSPTSLGQIDQLWFPQ